MQENNLTHTK